MLHIPPTKILISQPLKKKKKATQKRLETSFRKMEVYGKRGQKNGPKSERDKTERATGLGRKIGEEI